MSKTGQVVGKLPALTSSWLLQNSKTLPDTVPNKERTPARLPKTELSLPHPLPLLRADHRAHL